MWNDRSRQRLDGVDPRLIEVLEAAQKNTGINFQISEGMRDQARQREMVRTGKSQTMNSRHLHGGATDVHILNPDGSANWDFEAYRPLADAAKTAAAELGYDDFVWGGDWKTLKDGVHFQMGGRPNNTTMTGSGAQGVLSGNQKGDTMGNPQTVPMPDRLLPQDYETASGIGALFPGKGENGWLKSKLAPEMHNQAYADRLLAIGSGLLSGNDWASGVGNAAENMRGVLNGEQAIEQDVNQQNAQFDWREDQAQRDRDWRDGQREEDRQFKRDNPTGRAYQAMGMAVMKDGTERADIMFNKASGQYTDGEGNDVSGSIAEWINKSDSYGTKGQLTIPQANKMRSELVQQHGTLETMDRVFTTLNDVNYGAEGLADELRFYVKTFSEMGLTSEEIERKAAQGELQALIGSMRTEVVGPGVMTEQDALRVIAAMGGDMKSLFSNPEVSRDLLSKHREKLLRQYDMGTQQYNSVVDTYKNIPYVRYNETYETPKGLYDRPKAPPAPKSVEGGALSSNGIPKDVDPADWEMLTPEERELWN